MTTKSTTSDRAYRRSITATVNGREITRDVDTRTTLADFLREDLELVSVHLGCEQGVCGCCNVLMDGQSVRSCIMLAVQVNGHEVETVESLSADPNSLHPIQEAFHEEHGLQCGFCTPAMVLRTKEMLAEQQERTDEEVRDGISGILCRCTGYQNIVNAVQCASRKIARQSPAPVAAGVGTGGENSDSEGKA
ncbi:(2Fe-2S)-binding protein [Arthrobacter crystallopoietes]|uniref:(2Fe-2S)-binding protein n=1 Tax=Crystallibacter crystallopoietes TaxID=37928 RepID=UPI001110FF55|nr:(2Fe-2S)-binding protein [Arthrobacter crystallopoietes]